MACLFDSFVHHLTVYHWQSPSVNLKGLAFVGASVLFIPALVLTSWIARPNGVLEKAVNGLCNGIALVFSADSRREVAQSSKIAALSTLYIAVTYGITGVAGVAGVNAGNKEGRDNCHPRAQVKDMQGLPLRMYSAHCNLTEKFPGVNLTEALAQTMAPGNRVIINLLGLHVISKVFMHYPLYLLNVAGGNRRTLVHVIATTSIFNVASKLSKLSRELCGTDLNRNLYAKRKAQSAKDFGYSRH